MSDKNDYLGFREVVLSNEDMADFYQKLDENIFDCLINEYLILKDENGEIVDKLRWRGDRYVSVICKSIKNDFSNTIKPRNLQQVLAIDMLYNKDITIKTLTGNFGTGKDFLMISAALDLIDNGKFERILWVRNTIPVKDTKEIGYLPGSAKDKLLPFAMILADHMAGIDGLFFQMSQGRVEIENLGAIRGRSFKNTIIICSEAENMTKEHVQLLIGRVGEGSSLWLNGDYRQIDAKVFERNNGLLIAIDKLKGHPKFGYVKLLKNERSETAAMADLLD